MITTTELYVGTKAELTKHFSELVKDTFDPNNKATAFQIGGMSVTTQIENAHKSKEKFVKLYFMKRVSKTSDKYNLESVYLEITD